LARRRAVELLLESSLLVQLLPSTPTLRISPRNTRSASGLGQKPLRANAASSPSSYTHKCTVAALIDACCDGDKSANPSRNASSVKLAMAFAGENSGPARFPAPSGISRKQDWPDATNWAKTLR
jgi:hypothetical protein